MGPRASGAHMALGDSGSVAHTVLRVKRLLKVQKLILGSSIHMSREDIVVVQESEPHQ